MSDRALTAAGLSARFVQRALFRSGSPGCRPQRPLVDTEGGHRIPVPNSDRSVFRAAGRAYGV